MPNASDTPEKVDPATDEAFGQGGVRQHLGRAVSWVSILLMLVSLAMWYRSSVFVDQVRYSAQNQTLGVQSLHGSLMMSASTFASRPPGSPGWNLQPPRPISWRTRDPWQPSVFKSIGFELQAQSPNPSASSGFWLRVKWYFLSAIFAVVPLGRAFIRFRKKRLETP